MDETLGQKLRKARTGRGLSVEDAARATKIRAGRILDLENDSYDNFSHIAYAKNFVVLYARYLAVDCTPYLDDFNTGGGIDVDEYQYLRDTAPVAQIRRPVHRRRARPLVALAGTVMIGLAGLFFWFVLISIQRLGDIDILAERQKGGTPTAAMAASVEPIPLTPAATLTLAQSPEEILSRETAGAVDLPAGSEILPISNPSTGTSLIASLEPAGMIAPPPPTPERAFAAAVVPEEEAPVAVATGKNEVVLRPLRETWVTVTLNDPDASPAFDNFLRPGDSALRFTGERFWVFVNDVNSVEILKNSELVPQTNTSLYIQ